MLRNVVKCYGRTLAPRLSSTFSSSNQHFKNENFYSNQFLRMSTASPKQDFKIEHDSKKQKFIVQLDPDNSAFVNYERLANDEVLLYHTEVPENFRSTGVAKILAQEVLKHFSDSKQKMVITCTYLQKVDKEMKRAKTP